MDVKICPMTSEVQLPERFRGWNRYIIGQVRINVKGGLNQKRDRCVTNLAWENIRQRA